MPLPPETQAETLLRFLRGNPSTTQQCRDAMHNSHHRLASIKTEELLYELRDEGVIAHANGAWYVPNSTRLVKPKRHQSAHPKQLKLFED